LQNIGIDNLRQSITTAASASSKPPSTRGISNKRKIPGSSPPPTRRSSRVTLERVRVELEEAKQSGDSTLLEEKKTQLSELQSRKEAATYEPTMQMVDDSIERFSASVNISLSSPLNLKQKEEEEKQEDPSSNPLHLLRGIHNEIESQPSIPDPHDIDAYRKRLKGLSLQETDVAKVGKSRLTCVSFHPSSHKTIVFAGDKIGYVGIWDVGSKSAQDGVYLYRPHVSNICTIHCSSHTPSQVWSVSYDGTIRHTDMEKAAFVHSFSTPDDADYYLTDAHFGSSGSTHNLPVGEVYLSRSDGTVQMVDVRTGEVGYEGSVSTGQS
jgi:WD repeat-containing protein 76